MFCQLAGRLASIELLHTLFARCAKLSKIKPYDIRAMTSQGGVKSTEIVCVKDNLSSIVEGTHTHAFSLVLHRSCTHTEITFPPVVENEAVYQQPVIQIAHLQPQTHTYTVTQQAGFQWSLNAFQVNYAFLNFAVFIYFNIICTRHCVLLDIYLSVCWFLLCYKTKIKIDTQSSVL